MRFFVVNVALALAGCAAEPGDLNADGRVDCRDLDGVFAARELRFAALHEPGRVVALDEVTLEFLLYDGVFRSLVLEDGEERRSSGRAFTDVPHALTVQGALVPRAEPGERPLICDYDFAGGRLGLRGEARYDFRGDGVRGSVEALLELEADRVAPP